jgi:acyl-CoA hydrolase
MANILAVPVPPHRLPIPIHDPLDKIGQPYALVDPAKVVCVVLNDEPDGGRGFAPLDDVSRAIAAHVSRFLLDEMAAGRGPRRFLPLQSGVVVGIDGNDVVAGLAAQEGLPKFKVFTEVLQDAMLDLLISGQMLAARHSVVWHSALARPCSCARPLVTTS